MARKKKQQPEQPEQPAHTAEELALLEKYPDRRIKPGSLGPAPDLGPGKKAVVILCANCEAERRVATQDLFQVKHCLACAAEARKRKRSKSGAKPGGLQARRFDVRHNGDDLPDVSHDQLLALVERGEEVLLTGCGMRIARLESGQWSVTDERTGQELGPFDDAARAVRAAASE